jgi:hypothetical protein
LPAIMPSVELSMPLVAVSLCEIIQVKVIK